MTDNTIVKTVDLDSLEEFFPGASAESVITQEQVTPTKSVLSGEDQVNLDPKELTPVVPAAKPAAGSTEVKLEEEAVSFEELVEQQQEQNSTSGRAKTDKSGIVELYKKRIEAGTMVPFDDYKDGDDLEKYLGSLSMADMEALWDANLSRKEEELKEQVPQDFFNALPEELQFAAKYVADGGTDLKGLFKALAQLEEVREMDPEKNPRDVAYQYLRATNFGDDAEIQEQLDEWEDMGALTKKAQGFKPKLDKMQEQIVEQQLQQQAVRKEQEQRAALEYVQNVQTALKEPEIAGIKLDKKTHEFLTQGLLQPAYPSISGRNTNLLGHLLEKHQIVEPNYPLIAEALWLLSNPDEYRSKLIEKGATKANDKTVRELKTEQSRRIGSGQSVNEDAETRTRGARVARPGNVLRR